MHAGPYYSRGAVGGGLGLSIVGDPRVELTDPPGYSDPSCPFAAVAKANRTPHPPPLAE